MTDQILSLLGRVLLEGGGAAAVAFLIFRFLGKSWIESKFAERLEHYKHQQAVELQRLRVQIDAMLSGAIKMQDREFEILPELWTHLDKAYGLTKWLTSPFQEYPNVEALADDELEEFLAGSELLESQKKRVREAARNQRNATYQRLIFRHRIKRAKDAVVQFEDCVAQKGIFLPKAIKEKVSNIPRACWAAISCCSIGFDNNDWELRRKSYEDFEKVVGPAYIEIEGEIDHRLHSHGQDPA